MLGIDLLCLWLANQIWPDESKKIEKQGRSAENSANWIILDGANRQLGKEDWDNTIDKQSAEAPNDPPMDYDGDYYDGPDW